VDTFGAINELRESCPPATTEVEDVVEIRNLATARKVKKDMVSAVVRS
jgi:hypothetical protein